MHTNKRQLSRLLPAALLMLPLVLLAPFFTQGRCDDSSAATEPAPANPFDAYKTQTSGAVTITCPPGEEDFANEILQAYHFPLRIIDNASFTAQLDRWKKHDLAFIAQTLALEKPTADMETGFEQFRAMCEPAVAEEIGEVRIYHFTDIKEAHARGIAIEGINYLPKTDSVSIANYIAANLAGGHKMRVIPIVLMPGIPDGTDEKMRLFNGALRDMRWRLDEAIYNAYCAKLYEIARPSILASIDKARFPLWLIDGLTNAVPLIVMRSHNPKLSFEQLLLAHSPIPPGVSDYIDRINLDTWLATRSPATTRPETDAYSYIALLATLNAVGDAGEEWIPSLFKRLREENSPALNMANIYQIYTQLTGGRDLRENIANVKERLAKK